MRIVLYAFAVSALSLLALSIDYRSGSPLLRLTDLVPIGDREDLNGATVHLKGYLHCENEFYALVPSDAKESISRSSVIWLDLNEFDGVLCRELHTRGWVTVKGQLHFGDKRGYGHLGMFRAQLSDCSITVKPFALRLFAALVPGVALVAAARIGQRRRMRP